MPVNLFRNLLSGALASLLFISTTILPADADAPPVRIGVVTGGGSGIEQEIVDRISSRLEQNSGVKISTVNPDWFVVCNIKEFMDQMSGQIRYNGNVLIKTTSGQVLSTVAVQQYKQDFSLSPGAQLNKALVDKAAREAVAGAADRAVPAIEEAVTVEMDTRSKIIQAQIVADQEQYDQAINSLRLVSPDSPHFKNVRDLMSEFAMEKDALAKLNEAQTQAKSGKYSSALATLKQIPSKSKYRKKADELTSSYRAASGRGSGKVAKKPANKTTGKTATSGAADLHALNKVLEIEKKAIEKTQAEVRSKLKTK